MSDDTEKKLSYERKRREIITDKFSTLQGQLARHGFAKSDLISQADILSATIEALKAAVQRGDRRSKNARLNEAKKVRAIRIHINEGVAEFLGIQDFHQFVSFFGTPSFLGFCSALSVALRLASFSLPIRGPLSPTIFFSKSNIYMIEF